MSTKVMLAWCRCMSSLPIHPISFSSRIGRSFRYATRLLSPSFASYPSDYHSIILCDNTTSAQVRQTILANENNLLDLESLENPGEGVSIDLSGTT
jgi:hypothetical protein